MVERLRAVNTPRSIEPPVTLNPTAEVSVASGRVRAPLTVFKEAPVPMKSVALVMAMPSNSPCSNSVDPVEVR